MALIAEIKYKNFLGSGNSTERVQSKTGEVKDIVNTFKGRLGIGTIAKVYDVNGEGEKKYVCTLYSQYSIKYSSKGRNVKVLSKPNVCFDEKMSIEDTLV